MHPFIKESVILPLLLSSTILCSCSTTESDQAWQMVALGIPDSVTPQIAGINMGYYILKQTHVPYFDLIENGREYRSRLFSSWSRSQDYRWFNFCLRDDLHFDNNYPFVMSDFYNNINILSESFDPNRALVRTGNCIEITFHKPHPTFMRYLARYENAPSHKTENPRIDLGLGTYHAVALSNDKLLLQRKISSSDGYNNILISSYSGKDDPILLDRTIEDFNRVTLVDVPSWLYFRRVKILPRCHLDRGERSLGFLTFVRNDTLRISSKKNEN